MPPWFAVKGFGVFRNDLSASQEDISVIASWVEGGAPKGDAALLPTPHEHETEQDSAAVGDARSGGSSIAIESETNLTHEAIIAAIRPENVPEGGSLQAVAHRPDGSVEHLLWLRDFDPRWHRDYVFREPVHLPRGTRIILTPEGVTVSLTEAVDSERVP
jgi:hypothetical protein